MLIVVGRPFRRNSDEEACCSTLASFDGLVRRAIYEEHIVENKPIITKLGHLSSCILKSVKNCKLAIATETHDYLSRITTTLYAQSRIKPKAAVSQSFDLLVRLY